MTPDHAQAPAIALAIVAIGLISLAALAYLTAPQALRTLLDGEAPPSSSPHTFTLDHSSGDLLLRYIRGPKLPIDHLTIQRDNHNLEPCLSHECPRNATMQPGDHARVRCQPQGDHRTTLLLRDNTLLNKVIPCAG
jgi:hypothetical protein